MARRPLVAGNWKMNGLSAAITTLDRIIAGAPRKLRPGRCDDLSAVHPRCELRCARGRNAVAIGGQDCHAAASGAHTGDIAAEMLADAGAPAVSSATPSGAVNMTRPMRMSAPRR